MKKNYSYKIQQSKERLKKMITWPLFGIMKIINLLFNRTKMQSDTVTQPTSQILFHHIKDLPLSIFINCSCDNDLSQLGTGTDKELQDAWDVLQEQYNEAIGGSDIISKIGNVKQIYVLQNKVLLCETLIKVLNIAPNEATFKLLYTMDYLLPNYEYSLENISHVLTAFEGWVKRDYMELQGAITQLEADTKGNESKPTRDNFIKMIVAIAEQFKVVINEDKISTLKFCIFMNRYNEVVDALIRANNTNK